MTEWFVGPIMDKIINSCFDYMKDQFICPKSMKEALERLQRLLPKIQSVVDYALSQAHIRDQNTALNRWLWQLRDAVDEADDLLDEFEYMKLKKQLMTGNNMEETTTKKRKVSSVITSFVIEPVRKILKIGESAVKIDPNLKRLEEVVQNLDEVSADFGNFLHLLESTKQEQLEQQLDLYKTRETGSLPKNDQIGRHREKEFVVQWLIGKPSKEHQTNITTGTTLFGNISLLSIVGHGGMGKTTLLQHVYEDKMTEGFDLRMWVCVSNNFDVKKVIADMLESLKKERPRLESLHTLQESLKSEVMSKKFLLVLDDIWEEEEERDKSKWENVLAPLVYGSLGSKILITTRMDSVALMISKVIKRKKETLRLEGLQEDECLQLLNSHAFADVENPSDHEKLRSIAGKIVKKLSGSPLAAKVLGGVLNSNLDERHWTRVLNIDIESAESSQSGILPILRLSYTYLSKSLQSCFTFCCIFPQDHQFDKDDLVRMWIALGFIQLSCNRGETVQDIGRRYFDILVKKSFFDEFSGGVKSYYKMHDLLHELAQSVSAHECFKCMGDDELFFRIPETIRHLSVKTRNLELLRKMGKFKKLRSLFLTYDEDNYDFVDVLNEMFKASRSIRLLYIHSLQLKLIPEEIGYLIHLRYLKIYNATVTLLPRSLSNLYHLQFIIYRPFKYHPKDFFPSDINNLSNLQYLELHCDSFSGIYGIGKLKSLQILDAFSIKNEIGYRIEELEHMNDLRQLRIKLIENVKDVEDACSAKLYHKSNLTDLSLEWGDVVVYGSEPKHYIKRGISLNIANPELDERVLDNLRPQNILKKLCIYSFMGTRSAIWMNNANFISNLEYIQLDECLKWETLPPFGQLPFLKSLYLHNMSKVKRLDNKFHGNDKDCVFPSLEVLHIKNLEALENWFDAAATISDCLFPCLTELHLKNCPNLRELPFLPPVLKILMIDNIGWKDFNWFQGTSNCCIQKLAIRRNDDLVSLPIEAEQRFFQVNSSLCKLYFIRLNSLQYLPSSWESLASLKILHVRMVPQLQLLPNIPASLERLELEALKSLQCLPSSMSTISSLKYLKLTRIPLLKSLPDLPPSLCILHLEDLKSLTSLHPFVIEKGPQLRQLPYLPSSLYELKFLILESLQSLPISLESLASLKILHVQKVPQLQLLPNIPASLERLELVALKSLQCLPSSMSTISSLKNLELKNIPLLKSLPDLPLSLSLVLLKDLKNLNCLPSSLPSHSSLQALVICKVPQLQLLPNIPASLEHLELEELESLQCLPSSMLTISSLKYLKLRSIPLLKSLPDLPPSLSSVFLYDLKKLNCLPSNLSSLSSLRYLYIDKVPQLQEVPDLPSSLNRLEFKSLESLQSLPSSLACLSSLKNLRVDMVPQLQLLPNIPASLEQLGLRQLKSLQCLPSSLSVSSLKYLHLISLPLLKSFPVLPPSLCKLHLHQLENLDCLPSSFSSISSLKKLYIYRVPQLWKLPELPPFLAKLIIIHCHPELMERYEKFSGSDWHKIARIPDVHISNTDDRLSLLNKEARFMCI